MRPPALLVLAIILAIGPLAHAGVGRQEILVRHDGALVGLSRLTTWTRTSKKTGRVTLMKREVRYHAVENGDQVEIGPKDWTDTTSGTVLGDAAEGRVVLRRTSRDASKPLVTVVESVEQRNDDGSRDVVQKFTFDRAGKPRLSYRMSARLAGSDPVTIHAFRSLAGGAEEVQLTTDLEMPRLIAD